MSNWSRPYHQEYEQKPYLFYAAFADFGVQDIDYSGSLARGMIKFGRPDLSIHDVRPEEFELCQKVLDRFINFQALGGVIEEGRPTVREGLQAELRPGPVKGSTDDPDFNNYHIELLRG